jgi:TRAP-type C4-dicarboxylate transport system permease small subunit
VKKLLRTLDEATKIVIYVLLACMIVNTASSVFARYVLQNAISWSEEASRYLMVWMGFLGMSLAMRDGEHVSVVFVVDAMPGSLRRILRYLAQAVSLAFLVLLLIYSISQLSTVRDQTSIALMLPMSVPYAAVTAGAALMVIQSLRRITALVREDLGRSRGGQA